MNSDSAAHQARLTSRSLPQSWPSSTSAALRLRRAARLVHCLQKERGVSCALCASPASGQAPTRAPPSPFRVAFAERDSNGGAAIPSTVATLSEIILTARHNSDTAIDALVSGYRNDPNPHDKLPLRESLGKIRSMVDASVATDHPSSPLFGSSAQKTMSRPPLWSREHTPPLDGDGPHRQQYQPDQSLGFHRIMVAFSALIANVTHIMIVQRCNALRLKLHTESKKKVRKDIESSGKKVRLKSHSSGLAKKEVSTGSLAAEDMGGPCNIVKCVGGIGGLLEAYQNNPNNSTSTSPVKKEASNDTSSTFNASISSMPTAPMPWVARSLDDSLPPPSAMLGLTSMSPLRPTTNEEANKCLASVPMTNSVRPRFPSSDYLNAAGQQIKRGREGPTKTSHHRRSESDYLRAPSAGSGQKLWPAKIPTSEPKKSVNVEVEPALISLLLSFVSLKESTGVERAILSSLMAMVTSGQESTVDVKNRSNQDISSNQDTPPKLPSQHTTHRTPPKAPNNQATYRILFGDLVLEEENRRKIVRDLRAKAYKIHQRNEGSHSPGRHVDNFYSLLALVDQAVQPDPEMEELHNAVRVNFDLEKFHGGMTLEQFWKSITVYIDRLHSLELLIMEELECCLATAERRAQNIETPKPAQKISGFAADADAGAGHCKEKMSTIRTVQKDQQDKVVETDLMDVSKLLQSLSSGNVKSRSEVLDAFTDMDAEDLKASLLKVLGGGEPESGGGTPAAEEGTGSSPKLSSNAEDESIFLLPSGPTNTLHPHASEAENKEWEIDPYELEFRKRIGRGVAGTTYLAHWSGQKVAVKVAAITDMGLEGWNTEIRSLRRLHHPNIIRFLGSIYNPSPCTYGLVLEFCDAGDLSAALCRWTPPNFFFRVAGDMANGMCYLHSKKLLHRDIKPANVLLHGDVAGGNFTAKVADFGVAAITHGPTDIEHTAETGTYRWMAPEVIRHESYSFQADIFSYALVVWQLLTREEPFSKVSQIEAAGKVALELARPPFPRDTPIQVMSFISQCWSEDPEKRIPFDLIKTELKEMQKTLSKVDREFLEVAFGHPVYEILTSTVAEDGQGSIFRKPHPNFDQSKLLPPRSKSWAIEVPEPESKNTGAKITNKKRGGGGWGFLKKKK